MKNLTLGSNVGSQSLDASITLATTPSRRFTVRANVWKVPSLWGGSESYEKRLYSYDAPHDHNFDFLTVGYYGPGYTTNLWQYQYSPGLLPGDRVDISYCGRETLATGDVMFYRKSRDIYSQLPPERLSIRLNRFANSRDIDNRPQFYFDVERGLVSNMVMGPTLRRRELLDIAGALNMKEAVEPMTIIASSSPCSRTRQAAQANLALIGKYGGA